MTPKSGTQLDQYRLVEVIGEGGMGVVWRARDTALDRDVAVKVLPAAFTADSDRLTRFEREAKVVAALSHPNIVAIHGFGNTEGVSYAAMELLDGRSLRELLNEGPLPLRKAVDLARQIAEGLDAAHARGVVHRDLKPDNVFVGPDGRARILDFGLAATAALAGSDSSSPEAETVVGLTDPGTVVGTANYMAPEQARGGQTDPATDIFALGVMLHEMLTGETPFARETTAETLTAVLREDPPELTLGGRPTPAGLARLVRRCLEKQPHERFRNARDLAFALDSAVVESSTSQPSIAVADEENRSRAIVGLRPVLAAVALLAAFAAGWWLRPVPAERTPVRITELTFTGADFQPDVSPDNRLIAFTSSRTGVSQIWLRQVEGGGEQPITEGPDARPRFSPDGEAVAFIRKEGDGYSAYRVPVLGGQPRKMVEDVYAVAWSPDRRSLAFLRTGADARQRSGTILGILDLQSGEERVLLQLDGWGLYSPSWSPDSRRIAVTRVGTQGGTGNWLQLVVNALDGMVREVRSDREIVSAATWVGNDALIFAKMMR